jgi:hypothetical protein
MSISRFINFLLLATAELWVWVTALKSVMGLPVPYRREQIFWLYVLAIIAAFLSTIIFSATSNEEKGASKAIIFMVVIVGLMVAQQFVFGLGSSFIANFIPPLRLSDIALIFLLSFAGAFIGKFQSPSAGTRFLHQALLVFKMISLFIAICLAAALVDQGSFAADMAWIVLFSVPISLFFSFCIYRATPESANR